MGKDSEVGEDMSTLLARLEGGARQRPFGETAALREETVFDDFPLTGTHSGSGVLREMCKVAGGPVSRDGRWPTETGIESGDRSAYELEVLSCTREWGRTCDMVSIKASAVWGQPAADSR